MARTKSSGITDSLYRALLKLVLFVLVLSAMIFVINILGAWAIHMINPHCAKFTTIYAGITTSEYIVAFILVFGIVLIKKAL